MQTMRADNLTSIYGEKTLFKDVSFIINEGDRIGLIGTNGSGKTSLLNVISGVNSADSGNIDTPNDYRIAYLRQTPDLPKDKTIMDAIFEGRTGVFQIIRRYEEALSKFTKHPEDNQAQNDFTKQQAAMDASDAWEADSKIKTILTQLKLPDLTQTIGQLSGGQQKRVGLAQVLIQDPDLLLLDEPTNQLDLDSILWLQDYLASYKGAVLFVTHDRYFLDAVANHIWELSFGTLYHYEGNYQDYVAKKAERVELAKDAEKKRQSLYKKELDWMRHGAKARTTKQKGRIRRFHELEKNVGNLQVDGKVSIGLSTTRLGKDVLELDHAKLDFGNRHILNDLNLLIKGGDRIGVTGQNGAGKTTLLNVLAGQQKLDSGTLKVGETVKIGYYRQQNEEIDGNKRLINYVSEVADSVVDETGNRVNVANLLEQFLFPRSMHGTLVRKLSGGEKRRLYLLKILMQQPNVLLLDEPTNDLDIATLNVLEDYLDTFPGTVITVSHDRYFLNRVADDLLIFHGDANIEKYTGLFTDYLKAHHGTTRTDEQPSPSKANKAAKKPENANKQSSPKKKTKLTYAEELEWKQINKDLDQLSDQESSIEDQMNHNGDDYDKLAQLQSQLDDVKKEIDQKTARWDYLSNYVDD